MKNVFLGLGTNLGDRRANLEKALNLIISKTKGVDLQISPIYENAALLPSLSPSEWNRPFLNLVINFKTSLKPLELLKQSQSVEQEIGRISMPKWAPRIIDVDLLFYDDEYLRKENLEIPHPSISERAFVLDPLKDLNYKYIQLARNHHKHMPLLMGIVNITSESFSDGGRFLKPEFDENSFIQYLKEIIEFNIQILDIGAESTRPGALPLSPQEEWARLFPVLKCLNLFFQDKRLKPLISLDTRNLETIRKSMDYGINWWNDVSGDLSLDKIEFLKGNSIKYVLMHSLGAPANPKKNLDQKQSVVFQIKEWFVEKLRILEKSGIESNRIILDPGIGFGKTRLQNYELLRNMDEFNEFPFLLLVGHSRKSFLNDLTQRDFSDRDVETLAMSLQLKVDVLRVHDPFMHARALLAKNHIG